MVLDPQRYAVGAARYDEAVAPSGELRPSFVTLGRLLADAAPGELADRQRSPTGCSTRKGPVISSTNWPSIERCTGRRTRRPVACGPPTVGRGGSTPCRS